MKQTGMKWVKIFAMILIVGAIIGLILYISEVHSTKKPERIYNDIMECFMPENVPIEDSISSLWEKGGNHSELALILRSEIRHYQTEENEYSKTVIEGLAKYLMENAYTVGGDGMTIGYGMNGTSLENTGAAVIRDNTVYTIQTAEVMLAFCDLLEVQSEKLDVDEIGIKEILYKCCTDYAESVYVESGDHCYFAYDNSVEDREMEIVNTSSMLAGAIAKVMTICPDIFSDEEIDALLVRLNAVYTTINEEKIEDNNIVQWRYCVSDPESTYNDLIHMGFIYEGLHNLSFVLDNVSTEGIFESFYSNLDENNVIYNFPVAFSLDYQSKSLLRSLGAALYVMPEDRDFMEFAIRQLDEYDIEEYLEKYPNYSFPHGNGFLRNEIFFLLYGLSYYCYG